MRKSLIFLTCFFLLITTQTLNSKEIRSMFGFYVDIPDEYELLQNLNLDDLIKENPKEIKLKSPVIFKFVHEGPFRKTKLMNYYLQVYKGNSTSISLLCEVKNCNLLYDDLISITNSIKK